MTHNCVNFATEYTARCSSALAKVSRTQLARVARLLFNAWRDGTQVLLAGNGGSASAASHFACDLSKTALGPTPRLANRRFQVLSLNDNMALLTAWANDEGFEHVFSEQLRAIASPGDLLVVITGSGNSPNILRALGAARELGAHTVGLLGFDGGKAKELVDEVVLVESNDYGIVEGVHGILTHMLTAWLRHEIAATRSPRLRPVRPAAVPFALLAAAQPPPTVVLAPQP
jgi:D-sedoheptulose 7-phosphate isomerase